MMAKISARIFAKCIAGPNCCVIWTGMTSKSGYPVVKVAGSPKRGNRLVLKEKMGRDILPGYMSLHSCDNRLCLNPSHLREGTHQDNMADRKARERSARGEKNAKARLTSSDVASIRRLYSEGGLFQREIGDIFGITQGMVGHIVRRKNWSHL